jgi:N-methylhydantoinase A
VPPAAGLFSALGLLFAEIEHQCIRAFYQPFDAINMEHCNKVLASLWDEADGLIAADGYEPNYRNVKCFADLRYVGQNTALTLPIPNPPLNAAKLAEIEETFAQAHESTFGYRSDEESVQFVTVKVVSQGLSATPRVPDKVTVPEGLPKSGHRDAYYGKEHGWIATPIIARIDLRADPRPGPLIVEEYDSTTVVRPGWTAALDDWNNIILIRTGV